MKDMARSYMSRMTDFGESGWSPTHGWLLRYVLYAWKSNSSRGLGYVTSWRRSMRSSYSTPSAFIAATASPFALFSWATRICRGSSRVDSTTDTMSRA